jgi:hypothetical protein
MPAKKKPKRSIKPKKQKVLQKDFKDDARSAIQQTLKPKGPRLNHLKDFQFSKGESPNPGGRPKDPFSKKAIKAFTDADFKDILDVLIEQDLQALKDIAKGGEGYSIIKVMTARVALKVISTGSAKDFEIFLTRLIGKPRSIIQLEGPSNPQTPTTSVGGAPIHASVQIVIPSNGKEADLKT